MNDCYYQVMEQYVEVWENMSHFSTLQQAKNIVIRGWGGYKTDFYLWLIITCTTYIHRVPTETCNLTWEPGGREINQNLTENFEKLGLKAELYKDGRQTLKIAISTLKNG